MSGFAADWQWKGLPRDWLYVISRRDARALVARLAPQLVRVEFIGMCDKPGGWFSSLLLGRFSARCTKHGWRFCFRQHGIQRALVGEHRFSLRDAVLLAIEEFVQERDPTARDSTVLPFELWLRSDVVDGRIEPKFKASRSEHQQSSYGARWWE